MKRAGFTLIELILVIAIIGIVAIFILPSFLNFSDTAETNTVQTIQSNLETNIGILHSQYVITGEAYDAEDIIKDLNDTGAELTIEDL